MPISWCGVVPCRWRGQAAEARKDHGDAAQRSSTPLLDDVEVPALVVLIEEPPIWHVAHEPFHTSSIAASARHLFAIETDADGRSMPVPRPYRGFNLCAPNRRKVGTTPAIVMVPGSSTDGHKMISTVRRLRQVEKSERAYCRLVHPNGKRAFEIFEDKQIRAVSAMAAPREWFKIELRS
jgi:hypothetical protein